MLKIDIAGYRISGDHQNTTLSKLTEVKKETKTHRVGELAETDARYFPTVESACVSLARRLAVGGNDVEVATLKEYVARLQAAEARIRQAITG